MGLPRAVAHDASAPEDPAHLAVGADDPVFHLVEVAAAVEHVLNAVGHPVAVVGMTQRAQGIDGDGAGRRLQAHEPEELRPAAQHAGRHVDVPHPDARGALRQLQDLLALPRRGVGVVGSFGHSLGLTPICMRGRASAGDVVTRQIALPSNRRASLGRARAAPNCRTGIRALRPGLDRSTAAAPAGPAKISCFRQNEVADRPRRGQLSAPMGCDIVIVASRPGPRRGSGLLSPPAPRGFVVGPGQLPQKKRHKTRSPHSQGRLTRRPCFFVTEACKRRADLGDGSVAHARYPILPDRLD